MNITLRRVTKKEYAQLINDAPTKYYATCAGVLAVKQREDQIVHAYFVDTCSEQPQPIETITASTVVVAGTDFQVAAYQQALQVRPGQTMSYQQLALQIKNPLAFRAIARAMATNKIAYFIPCHRIIKSNGDACGYNWGVHRKIALLEYEKGI